MSLQSWNEKYYPVDAHLIAATEPNNPLILIEHSLTKWRGLREKNLEAHGETDPPISLSSSTCSLCVRYFDEVKGDEDEKIDGCATCPLAQARGNVRCDREAKGEVISPYKTYLRKRDPEPMIRALEKARRFVRAGKYDPNAAA